MYELIHKGPVQFLLELHEAELEAIAGARREGELDSFATDGVALNSLAPRPCPAPGYLFYQFPVTVALTSASEMLM